MKKLALLKTITTIALIISVLVLIFSIPFILMTSFIPASIPFKINGVVAENLDTESVIFLLALVVGYAFYVYALYLFKKILELFEKKKIFHEDVIKNLDQTGKAILIGYLITVVAQFIYSMVTENRFEVELGVDLETMLVVCGGFFFMVLSEVFLMAKRLKDENDLTV